MELSVQELAALTGAELASGAPPDTPLTGFADLASAEKSDISFFANRAYLRQLRNTRAGAVLVPLHCEENLPETCLLKVENPSIAFAKVVERYRPPDPEPEAGVHPGAIVHPSAQVDGQQVSIGAGAVVEAHAKIGAGTVIGSNSTIGRFAQIGENCRIDANVSIRHACVVGNRVILNSGVVIGSDGFGFEFVEGCHRKIPQVGIVQIDDDVEIGANSTIDRARFGKTWIQEGTKIDNLVQIGHNVRVGRHCIIVAQSAIAGSTVVGDFVVMAAQCGAAGHLEIGPRSTLAARSGVTKNLPGGEAYAGYPAQPAGDERKLIARQHRLGNLFERVRRLEQAAGGSEEEGEV